MGMAYAWEKMSMALDSLATAPEPLPERLKHGLIPHFLSALHDAEQVHYLPPELLESMRTVRRRALSLAEGGEGGLEEKATLKKMSAKEAEDLAREIVEIAREIARLATF